MDLTQWTSLSLFIANFSATGLFVRELLKFDKIFPFILQTMFYHDSPSIACLRLEWRKLLWLVIRGFSFINKSLARRTFVDGNAFRTRQRTNHRLKVKKTSCQWEMYWIFHNSHKILGVTILHVLSFVEVITKIVRMYIFLYRPNP